MFFLVDVVTDLIVEFVLSLLHILLLRLSFLLHPASLSISSYSSSSPSYSSVLLLLLMLLVLLLLCLLLITIIVIMRFVLLVHGETGVCCYCCS